MSPSTELVTTILSFGTLLLGIALVVFISASIVVRAYGDQMRDSLIDRVILFVGNHALILGLILAVVGVGGTLYYSEIAGFEPCKLCWLQRIFFYPQLFIFAVALLRKTRDAFAYTLPLSTAGLIVAVYHYALQRGMTSPFPCSADVALSCSKQLFLKFGYITEVMMSVTAFAALIVLTLAYSYAQKRNVPSA